MANKFLESVAKIEAYSTTSDALIFTGFTNISSTFGLTMDSTDVRGGQGNGLLYVFKHSRAAEVTIEQATFSKDFLATNVGATIATAARDIYHSECLTLDGSGDGTVTNTPIGSVYVQAASGSITTVTPTGSDIAVPALADASVTCYYQYNLAGVERITISAQDTPDVVKLVLNANVKSNDGTLAEILQIVIPRFQVSGDYELSFTADGVSTESLSGMALQYESADCTGDIYGWFDYIPQSASLDYTVIYSVPHEYSVAVGDVPATQQLTVYGVRGGKADPVDVTSSCVFAMRAASDSDITVPAGLITIAGSATALDEGFVDITLVVGSNTIEESVHVLVTA